jgi:type I restriction enzyme S subunit
MKPGYKQTEVGVIPEEWEVFQLSNHLRIYAGGDMPKHSV